MTQDHKYFGMTPAQIGILAGLAGIACLLFGLTGWFVLRGKFSPVVQGTPVPQSTSTPFMLATLSPTETPTPISYEVLIPDGWLQFKTGLVEIWLPKEFKLGDSKLFSDSANSALRELVVTGAASNSAPDQMLVLVSYEPLPAGSLDAYLDSQIVNFPTNIRIAERRKVTINTVEAVQFVLETRNTTVDFNDLTYVFLDGSTIWYVEYVAEINEFYEMLPTFEQSVKTFRIVR